MNERERETFPFLCAVMFTPIVTVWDKGKGVMMLQDRARERERGGEISREREGEGGNIIALNNKARADTQKNQCQGAEIKR